MYSFITSQCSKQNKKHFCRQKKGIDPLAATAAVFIELVVHLPASATFFMFVQNIDQQMYNSITVICKWNLRTNENEVGVEKRKKMKNHNVCFFTVHESGWAAIGWDFQTTAEGWCFLKAEEKEVQKAICPLTYCFEWPSLAVSGETLRALRSAPVLCWSRPARFALHWAASRGTWVHCTSPAPASTSSLLSSSLALSLWLKKLLKTEEWK